MAYKLKSTFKIELTSPDGTAVLEFKRPLATKFLASLETDKPSLERVKEDWKAIAADLVSIEGMEDEAGKLVTVSDVASLNFDLKELVGIVQAYNAWVFNFKREDEAKKNSGSE